MLELGCGAGADTAALVKAGLSVVAIDLSTAAVQRASKRVPAATFLVRDVREDFPAEVEGTGVVVASLSLHYFGWNETVVLFDRIRQTLKAGGLFMCRLNSTLDSNFGATGHPEIEPNYFLVDGEPKRFFDRAAVDGVLSRGWQVLSVEHLLTGKYVKQKALWELACTKDAA